MTENLAQTSAARAADALFQAFEQMIRDGALKEGDPLPPEREIVQTYGVSRTVVREAVLKLSNKGLVEARPRFRPVVRKPNFDTAMDTVENVVGRLLQDPGGVQNLFETRIMIEAMLVRQAAVACASEDIERLEEALQANEAAIEDSEAFYLTDKAFHSVLYDIPRNPLLPAIQRAYSNWLAPQWSRMPRLPERNRRNHAAHSTIFMAIKSGNPDGAEEALRAHLAQAWEQVAGTFEVRKAGPA